MPTTAELPGSEASSVRPSYEVLARHTGCRSNSAQNQSFNIWNFGLDRVFRFAVSGTLGDFDQAAPRTDGVCVNSRLFWNHRVGGNQAL